MNFWQEIAQTFSDLTGILWASQIFGLIGFAITTFANTLSKKKFLLLGAIASVFFILEQVLASLYSNAIVSLICLIRNMIMFILLVKKNKETPFYILVILLGITWAFEFTYMGITNTLGNWLNYLPPAIITIATFGQNSKNEFVVKGFTIFHSSGFFVYYLINRLPFSILREIVLITACLVGLILLIYNNRKNSKTALNMANNELSDTSNNNI